MNTRFDDLRKVPKQPAMRLLSLANAKLQGPVKVAVSASVSEVMTELDTAKRFTDMLRLMSVALPARERTWWACLAARDLIGPVKTLPLPLSLAESWVRKPGDATRDKAREAIDHADASDDTVLCATCVLFCDDTLGPGDMAQYPAPPGAAQIAAFTMNIKVLALAPAIEPTAQVLIERALDISRGGNGQLPLPDAKTAQVSA